MISKMHKNIVPIFRPLVNFIVVDALLLQNDMGGGNGLDELGRVPGYSFSVHT